MKAAPTRVAAVVVLTAWAYILAANTTRWRAALEISPGGVVHPVANASTVTCSDHDVAANGSHSLDLSLDDVRRDAIRAEFAWSWHAVYATWATEPCGRSRLTSAILAFGSTNATLGRETS